MASGLTASYYSEVAMITVMYVHILHIFVTDSSSHRLRNLFENLSVDRKAKDEAVMLNATS